jgi:hypothetical protein
MTGKDALLIGAAVFAGTLAANLVAAKIVANQVQAQAQSTDLVSLVLGALKR